jgi:hypothetical protein
VIGSPDVAVPQTQRVSGNVQPDRLYVLVPHIDANESRRLARSAVAKARSLAPKLSGAGARGIDVYWGTGFFGLRWREPYVWYQNAGIRPFTMRSLAGKTIPMWIDDPTGQMSRDNPKAKTRMTVSGKRQVLIFRKAAHIGARKTKVTRDRQGRLIVRDVPASHPGAPGRITYRQWTDYPTGQSTGKIAGIAQLRTRANIGVRWRHPGLSGRRFLEHAILLTAEAAGYGTPTVYSTYRRR